MLVEGGGAVAGWLGGERHEGAGVVHGAAAGALDALDRPGGFGAALREGVVEGGEGGAPYATP